MVQRCHEKVQRLQQEEENKSKAAKKRKTIIIVSAVVISVVTIALIASWSKIKGGIETENKYKSAVSLFENENYTEAEKSFTELGGYKDSNAYIEKTKDAKYNKAVLLFESGEYKEARELFVSLNHYKDTDKYLYKVAEVGDVVKFGEYDWYVISRTDNDIQLLCIESVTKKEFDESGYTNIWGNCTLRKWLNDDFYNSFTDEEKSMIAETKDTLDKIYLLSYDEAEKLSKDIRKCDSWWWLRSPYPYNCYIVWCVCGDGGFDYSSYANNTCGVRPALNLKL